jgi:hypothetical protein
LILVLLQISKGYLEHSSLQPIWGNLVPKREREKTVLTSVHISNITHKSSIQMLSKKKSRVENRQ